MSPEKHIIIINDIFIIKYFSKYVHDYITYQSESWVLSFTVFFLKYFRDPTPTGQKTGSQYSPYVQTMYLHII